MLRITKFFIAGALAIMIAAPASAQSLQYLGPHTTDPAQFVQGNLGVLVYNDLCSAAFDGSQMCESIDVLRSGSPVPLGPPAVDQWVKPTLVLLGASGAGAALNVIDASGVVSNSVSILNGALSCGGWGPPPCPTCGVSREGLVMSTDGQFSKVFCAGAELAVACCKAAPATDSCKAAGGKK